MIAKDSYACVGSGVQECPSYRKTNMNLMVQLAFMHQYPMN